MPCFVLFRIKLSLFIKSDHNNLMKWIKNITAF
jgi:hypothetical protein